MHSSVAEKSVSGFSVYVLAGDALSVKVCPAELAQFSVNDAVVADWLARPRS
ncbi:MAG: hypothetical protein IPH50_12060 [Rhodanobacteraceae bacterium]|nr:hypothetical protein [Rhodanobacteraceae bacterium]